MLPKKSGIYRIRCCLIGEDYVGSSVNIQKRWHSHVWHLRRNKSPSSELQQAWNEHGEDAFVIDVLEECAIEELTRREQHWHVLLKPRLNRIAIGGGRRRSKATFEEIEARKRRNDTKAKMRRDAHRDEKREYDRERRERINADPEAKAERNCRNSEGKKARRAVDPAKAERERQEACEYAREYSKTHREERNEWRRQRKKNETPEQREHRLRLRRESERRLRKSKSPQERREFHRKRHRRLMDNPDHHEKRLVWRRDYRRRLKEAKESRSHPCLATTI